MDVFTAGGNPVNRAAEIWPFLAVPFLAVTGAAMLYPWAMRRTASRLIAEGENRGLFGRHRITITPESITEATPGGVTTRKWSYIERIAMGRSHLFVYTSAVEAIIIPKRAFENETAFHEFAEQTARYAGTQFVRLT